MVDLLALLPYLAPALGVVVSVGTLLFTGVSLLQKADTTYVNSLLARVRALEEEREAWDDERHKLHAEIAQLSQLLMQSTLLIRGDVAANTEVSRAAFSEANHAKKAIADAIKTIAEQTEVSNERLGHLEAAAAADARAGATLKDAAAQAAAALHVTAAEAAARFMKHGGQGDIPTAAPSPDDAQRDKRLDRLERQYREAHPPENEE